MSFEFFESVAAASNGGSTLQLTVQRSPERSSWVTLPPSLASQLYQSRGGLPLVLEVRAVLQRAGVSLPSDAPKYVAWGGACDSAGALGVPAGLLGSLGLAEGVSVLVRPLWDAPEAVAVTVEPASEDDWEMVELNAEFLEGQLLSQVGVVSLHQPFPFWVHAHLINLKVVALDPAGAPAARLVPGTEIHIAPRVRVRPGASAPHGQLFGNNQGKQSHQRQQRQGPANGGFGSEPEASLETALRVQCVAAGLAAKWAAAQLQQGLPPAVQPVAVSPITLERCGLREGDWVRLVGAKTAPTPARAAGRFASLVPCAEVAVGHVALMAEQCAAFGVAPFSHARVERLGRAQRALVMEAAELLQTRQRAAARETAGTATAQAAAAAAQSAALESVGVQVCPGKDQGGESGTQLAASEGIPGESGVPGEAEGISWLSGALEEALQAVLPVLAATPRLLLQSWGVPKPGGLLVSGPAGSGKSALVDAMGQALQRHQQCLAYPVMVRCREITIEGPGHAQALISAKVQEALDHMPSLLVFDDLDVLCHAGSDGPEGTGPSTADPSLVAWLCDVLDYLSAPSLEWGTLPSLAWQLHPGGPESPAPAALASNGHMGKERSIGSSGSSSGNRGQNGAAAAGNGRNQSDGAPAAGSGTLGSLPRQDEQRQLQRQQQQTLGIAGGTGPALWPPVALAATCNDPAVLASPLRAAGRLDHPLALPAPSAESRAAILAAGARARGATAAPRDLQTAAERADGFDAADLGVLLDRAMHLALRRQLACPQQPWQAMEAGHRGLGGPAGPGRQVAAMRGTPAVELVEGDLLGALQGMTPAAFWGVHTQTAVQQGVSGWEDVGGMEDVRAALYESLELPTKYAKLVAQAPLRLRTGVLLYGPPGCGKTHVVSAAVAAANVRCITVSGPELLNKYIGASEAAVRDVFRRAAAAAPSVLFFDEFDAIAPQRGHDNTGVTDRVVNQLLTELDGVEGLRGVCVIAATSRPDLIDAALLRPGRLDRLLYCGFPSPLERQKILRALARSLPLAPDVDLERMAYEAEFFTGADLSALLSEAQLAVVHETLDAEPPAPPGGPAGQPLHRHRHTGGMPVISCRHLDAALASARPSVPEAERDRLEAIYLRFQQSREPGGSAVDKGKGKRVSWA